MYELVYENLDKKQVIVELYEKHPTIRIKIIKLFSFMYKFISCEYNDFFE